MDRVLGYEPSGQRFESSPVQCLYTNDFKIWEFGKKAPWNFLFGGSDHCRKAAKTRRKIPMDLSKCGAGERSEPAWRERGQKFQVKADAAKNQFLNSFVYIYKMPFGPLETNTILIGCSKTKKAAVIDSAQGSTAAVLRKAKEAGLIIEKIFLTHSHWDHIADLHLLVEKTGAPVYVHRLDAPNVERPGSDRIPMMFEVQGVTSLNLIENGDFLDVGSLRCEVIHSPGHSRGSVCYFFREEKLLISGDTLFEGTIGTLSLPTAEPEKMWESLSFISKLPPDTHIVPGHGGDTILSKESWLSRAREIFS